MVIAYVGGFIAAVGAVETQGSAGEAAAACHAPLVLRRTLGIALGALVIVGGVVPVGAPFPDIAGHVHEAIGTGARRVGTYLKSSMSTAGGFGDGAHFPGKGSAPGIHSPIRAARCLLPLCFFGKPILVLNGQACNGTASASISTRATL